MEQSPDPRNKLPMYGQLLFDKGVKNAQWEKDNVLNK